MKTIKGPAIFLAQFAGDQAPFNSLDSIGKWASDLGYKAVQIPTWDNRAIDLQKAAESKTYCDELKGKVNSYGLEITELSTHLQGQLVAVHPAYDIMFDNFAPDSVKNNPKERTNADNVVNFKNLIFIIIRFWFMFFCFRHTYAPKTGLDLIH